MPVRARLGPHAGVAEWKTRRAQTPVGSAHGSSTLSARTSASRSVGNAMDSHPCRRGFESLETLGRCSGRLPGCSSVWEEHPVRSRGVSGSSPFNQTRGALSTAPVGSGPAVGTLGSGPRDGGSNPSSRAPEPRANAPSGRSSSIGRAPPRHGGGNASETRLWRQTLVVKRMITGDYESPVPGSSPGRGARAACCAPLRV